MYRLLLVDDERQILKGLRAKLNWMEHGFELCGDAANGLEALELIKQERPHVVITDIRMPVMDGIQLLEKCVSVYPNIQFIVLSGYEDFNYVKAALQFGARDYLLKPVIRKELVERLGQMKQELDEQQEIEGKGDDLQHRLDQSLQQLREQFWLQAVRASTHDRKWDEEAEKLGFGDLLNRNTMIRFITLEIKDLRGGTKGTAPDTLLQLAVYLMSREMLELWGEEAHLFRDSAAPQLLYLVFKCETFGEEELERWLTTEYSLLLETMLKVKVQLGIGDIVNGIANMRKGFLSSRINWMRKSPNESMELSDYAKQTEDRSEWFDLLPITEKQLTTAVREGDRESFQRTLRSVLEPDKPLNFQALSVRLLRLLLFIDALGLKLGVQLEETQHMISGLPESIWQCQDPILVDELFGRLAEQLMSQVGQEQQSGGLEVVQRVVDYLNEHYAEDDISLSRMANRFHLHVTYLSELFKKVTGTNYSEFITQLRITKAKQLLRDPLLKVADVAELVGFSNPNYFSLVFKKITGHSPNDYRQQQPKIL